MICRKIAQRNQWSFKRYWNSTRIIASQLGSLYPTQDRILAHSQTLVSFRNHCNGVFPSVPFGIKGCNFTTQATELPIGGVVDVPLAQTGEGIAECELLKWFVEEEDQVEEFQPICEVQSDKATIEITSRYRGKVFKILHDPGSIVNVGETLLKLVIDESTLPDQSSETLEILKGDDSSDSDTEVVASQLGEPNAGGVLSTPAVRNFAKQLGVNIEDVCGTGKGGRVLREDIQSYAAQAGILKENSASSSTSPAEQFLVADKKLTDDSSAFGWEFKDSTLSLRGFQRAMVKSMTLAAQIPHFHYVEEINCNALFQLKTSLQKENSDPSIKYTFLPVLIKSLSMALTKYPLINSCLSEGLEEVTLKGSHNIGIAMATPHGLVVPNIKKVQSLSIFEITKELYRLQQLALANKLNPDDISCGTITLSNIGAIGGKFGSPLVNVPEVSIIALGRIQRIAQFDEDGNVYPASVMTVNIGSDHRVLDGATVARFCNEWKLLIEKPELLMLHLR